MTAGFSTVWRRTCWPSKGTARCTGFLATTVSTRKSVAAVSVLRPIAHTALPTASYVGPRAAHGCCVRLVTPPNWRSQLRYAVHSWARGKQRERTMTTITLKALLEVLLGMQGTFVLCNAHGSLEFKGQDLYLSP